MRFLLDTNVLSEPVLERPSRKVLGKLLQHQGIVATAAPAFGELLLGARRLPKGRRRTRIEDYVAEAVRGVVPILPYCEESADWHASERARLESIGATPAFVDGQIAAIAATHDLVVVTRNVSHFSCFETVKVVSWHG